MVDREKVIKGLEMHKSGLCNALTENGKVYCPYYENNDNCMLALLTDAISLLKAQETRYIDKGADVILETGDIVRRWQCESCGDHILARFDSKPKFKYCSNCGKAVKWDEPPKEET